MNKTIRRLLSCALAALMMVSTMAIIANADDESIKENDTVSIKYGAHDYEDQELNRAFYAFDFDVTALDGEKATLTREFGVKDTLEWMEVNVANYEKALNAIGLEKVTITVDVNVNDLELYTSASPELHPYAGDVEEVAEGDKVAVKYDSKDADGKDVRKFMSFLDCEVKAVEEGIATIEAGANVVELVTGVLPYLSNDVINQYKDATMTAVNEMGDDLKVKSYTLKVAVEDLASLEAAEETPDDTNTDDTNTDDTNTDDTNTEDTATDILWGDADKSGKVDMMDVVTIQKFIAEIEVDIDEVAADVSLNGRATMMDVTTLQRFIAKLIDKLPLVEEISDVDTASEDTAADTASEDTAADTASEDTATEKDTSSEPEVGTDWRTNQPYVSIKLTIDGEEKAVLVLFDNAKDGEDTDCSNIIFYLDQEEQVEIGKIELETPIAKDGVQAARESLKAEDNKVTITVGEDSLVFEFDGKDKFTKVEA